jgi:N utilization substance protein A
LSLDDLAYCAVEDIAAVEGLDTDLAQELQKRARNSLLDSALKGASDDEDEAAVSLLDIPGMTREFAEQLAARDMAAVSALADAAVDEIEDIEGMTHEQAEALILAAREASGWFEG